MMLKQWGIAGLAFGLAVAALAACERGPVEPGGIVGDAGASGAHVADAGTLKSEGVTLAVNGAGQQWSSPPGGEMRPVLRRFAFGAQKHADGTVSGHYNIVAPSGLHIEGVITCLNVIGDRAWVGGTFGNAQPPPPFTPVGVVFELLDGGLGPDAVDQISGLGLFAAELGATEADVQAFCDDAIPGPIAPIDLGSIIVE